MGSFDDMLNTYATVNRLCGRLEPVMPELTEKLLGCDCSASMLTIEALMLKLVEKELGRPI